MERKQNPENRMHQLKGFGRDYQNREASLALAIVDSLNLFMTENNLVLTKKEDENVGISTSE